MELMNRMVGCIGIVALASVSLTRRGTFCVSDAKAVAKLRVAGRMPITRAWPRSTRTWRSLPSATNAPTRPVRRVAGAGVFRRSDRSAETHGPEGMGGETGESSTRYGAGDEVRELRVGPAGERRTKSCGPRRGRRTPGYARTGPPGRQGATTSARTDEIRITPETRDRLEELRDAAPAAGKTIVAIGGMLSLARPQHLVSILAAAPEGPWRSFSP